MVKFLSVMINPLRQLLRQRSFWVIQALLAAPPLLIALVASLNPSFLTTVRFNVPGIGEISLFLLVIPLLAAPVILRDLGQVGELLWSSPLDGLAHFIACYLGAWLAMLIASLVQLGAWFLGDLVFPSMLGAWAWGFSLIIYLIANTLALATLFLLVMILRRMLPLVITWVALWIWLFFDLVFSESFAESFRPMQSTAFNNIFFTHMQLSPSLGLGLGEGRFLGMVAWFLGLSLAVFGLALLVSFWADRRRATRLVQAPAGLFALGLIAALAGFVLNSRALNAYDLPASPYDPQIDLWIVQEQRASIEIDVGSGSLTGNSILVLLPSKAPQRPEVILRLNAGLGMTASDATGASLPTERLGDSIIIALPEIPKEPVTLNLSWQGELQYPYAVFEQFWKHSDAPFPYPYTHMPQLLQALLVKQGGYILRDGDWQPYPWTSGAHNAETSHIELRAEDAQVAAPIPLIDEAVIYDGAMPDALLAFLPTDQTSYRAMTIAASPLAGVQQVARAQAIASAAQRLSALADTPPPRNVIIAPYLSRLVWCDDLLLVPDGGGQYLSLPLGWFFWVDAVHTDQDQFQLFSTSRLAREWLLNRLPPPQRLFQPVLYQDSGQPQALLNPSKLDWEAKNSTWVQAVEAKDFETYWNPRRALEMNPAGKWAAVGFWLALELSDEDTRQENLAFTQELYDLFLAGQRVGDRQQALFQKLMWPDYMESEVTQRLVLQLHAWAEKIGLQQAVELAVDVIIENQPVTVEAWIAELELRSGKMIGE